jgi:dihydroflavonol-4-reductase
LALQLQAHSQKATLVSRSGGSVGDVTVEALDILDEEAVRKSARGCKSAYLCTGMVSRDPDDAGLLHRLHVDGTKSALAGLKKAGVERVVYASTSGVIAVGTDPDQIIDEAAPPPMEHIAGWPYYRSKYFGEQEALSFNEPGFEVVIVNPSLLLGPGDVRESSTEDVRRFLEKAVLATPAGGVALVDVRDAAAGMILAMQRGRAGERYLLNGANMTLGAFFARLSRISGVKAPMFSMPKNKALAQSVFGMYEKGIKALGGVPPVDKVSVELSQYYWYCSSEKAERELGFSPRDPGETLSDTVWDLVERQVVAPIEMRAKSRGE